MEVANLARLRTLTTPICDFEAVDGGSIEDVVQRDRLLADLIVSKRLSLRTGAQVLLLMRCVFVFH